MNQSSEKLEMPLREKSPPRHQKIASSNGRPMNIDLANKVTKAAGAEHKKLKSGTFSGAHRYGTGKKKREDSAGVQILKADYSSYKAVSGNPDG
jgi:hypothetical protein